MLVRFGQSQPQLKSTAVDGPIKIVISDRDNFNMNEVKLQMNESRSDRMWSGMVTAEMKKMSQIVLHLIFGSLIIVLIKLISIILRDWVIMLMLYGEV